MAKIVLEEENKTADNVEIEETTTEEVVAPTEDVATEPEEETTDDVAITYPEEAIDTGFEVDDTEESPDEDEGVMLLPSDEEDATPVYSGETVQATETGEGEGKKWDSYTTESDIADDDELMILDKSAKANKRTLLSKIADYVIDKLTTAVVSKLTTTDKTIPGAINELNSKPFFKEVEYGTGKITGESQTIRFKKNHTGTPTSVLLTYTEIASSVAGEPKNLKAFALSSTSFSVALSEFDGIERNFSWIAIW